MKDHLALQHSSTGEELVLCQTVKFPILSTYSKDQIHSTLRACVYTVTARPYPVCLAYLYSLSRVGSQSKNHPIGWFLQFRLNLEPENHTLF